MALLAIGLGNHLTIATVAPAFVVFALSTDARRVLRPRITGVGAVLIVLGCAQYGYILVRTMQGSPHLEASATTLAELVDVMRASRYEGDMFSLSWRELMGQPLETLAALVWREIGVPDALTIACGMLLGLWRAWRETALFALSALGVLALSLNIRADTAGFAVAALPPLGLLAALGAGLAPTSSRPGAWRARALSIVLAECRDRDPRQLPARRPRRSRLRTAPLDGRARSGPRPDTHHRALLYAGSVAALHAVRRGSRAPGSTSPVRIRSPRS